MVNDYQVALREIAAGKLFSGLPSDSEARKIEAEKIYRHYANLVHPDKRPHDSEAKEAFIELTRLKDIAIAPLNRPVFTPFTFKTRKNVYEVTGLKHEGGLARIYEATVGTKPIILKVPRSSRDNDLMAAEVAAIKAVPVALTVFESFAILDEKKKRKSVTAFIDHFKSDGVTVLEIKKAHPGGVDPRIMAFIFNRVLQFLSMLHLQGLRHGAVTPNHILINYRTHGGYLLDLTNAGAPSAKLVSFDKTYADYFPPEFPYHGFSADLYCAAKSMLYLLGGDPERNSIPVCVPQPMCAFLNKCLQPKAYNRFRTALYAHSAFQETLSSTYGAKKFVTLDMPVKQK